LQSIKYQVSGFSYNEALNTREVVNAWVDLIADLRYLQLKVCHQVMQ